MERIGVNDRYGQVGSLKNVRSFLALQGFLKIALEQLLFLTHHFTKTDSQGIITEIQNYFVDKD